jgi:hypothetical protein
VIVSVALKLKNSCILSLPKPKRHIDIIALPWGHEMLQRLDSPVFGFLNCKGEFLNRLEALKEVIDCSQSIIGIVNPAQGLYSENLW